MKHYFKERIEIRFTNMFSDIFLFSISYPYDRVRGHEGYYVKMGAELKRKVAQDERTPFDEIEMKIVIIKNEKRDYTVLTMASGIILEMPPGMKERDYEIIQAQLNVFMMIFQ